MGFEFEANIEPFAVYRIVNSLGICIGMSILSQTTTKESYRIFFTLCLILTVTSEIIMTLFFKFQNKKTIKKTLIDINNDKVIK